MEESKISLLAACARLTFLALLAVAVYPSVALAQGTTQAPASASSSHLSYDPDLDAGVNLLYQLKFDEARMRLIAWETQHPGEALGSTLEASAYLFEQFYRQGVLTSEFFLDDKRLLGGIEGKPDADLESAFLSAAGQAEQKARLRLSAQPRDADALLALTLVAGMRADNASLIEKRQLQTVSLLRESERRARDLLDVAPDASDAYLAIGAANYIVGCMPVYKRWFLRLGGVQGDKSLGMQQLSRAADGGHYLGPFAKTLLALAALREMDPGLTRAEFTDLHAEFPQNPLFERELSKLRPDPALSGAR